MTVKEFKIQYALGSLSRDNLLEIAKNRNTPKQILAILSVYENYWIRYSVSNNPNTSKKVLKTLSKEFYILTYNDFVGR